MTEATRDPEEDSGIGLSTRKSYSKASCLWKATFLPLPSYFWLLYSRSHPAENEPPQSRKLFSNQLYLSLQLFLHLPKNEILSSMRSRRTLFSWLKLVVWLHAELGGPIWPIFCHCFLIPRLSLRSYLLKENTEGHLHALGEKVLLWLV